MATETNDTLALIRKPIDGDMRRFAALFDEAMTHADGFLSEALSYIRRRKGKQMRPMLILLTARNFLRTAAGDAPLSEMTLRSALGLELLHTASLVHDDVVDESGERRGQRSVNAEYGNKVAVLVGDYVLSTALLNISLTRDADIMAYLSRLGRTLANGEILQLTSNGGEEISEETYYSVIRQKTAALFEACCAMGAMSVGADEDTVKAARLFGRNLGVIFQIKDDIFDYYDRSDIGKPTHNDMREGKLTLPAIHAALVSGNDEMLAIARKVKCREATDGEIVRLAKFARENGGIEYAETAMQRYRSECLSFIFEHVSDTALKTSFLTYVDYVMNRSI